MDEDIKAEVKRLKPVSVSFKERLKSDNSFLLALIENPIKGLKMYGFSSDDQMLHMLNSASLNIRERAIAIFTELGNRCSDAKGCEACDGCRICKGCSSLPIDMGDPGMMIRR